MAETAGGSTRASSSTANGQPVWPPCGVEVCITSLPCTLRRLSWRLGDIAHACHQCHRPCVQAGDGVRGPVSPFVLTARLDDLEQLREEGLADERDTSSGGAPHVWDGRRRAL